MRQNPSKDVGKGEIADNQHFLLFPQHFLKFAKQILNFLVKFIFSSANAFTFAQSKIKVQLGFTFLL